MNTTKLAPPIKQCQKDKGAPFLSFHFFFDAELPNLYIVHCTKINIVMVGERSLVEIPTSNLV